jgi:glucokinase
MSSSCVLALDVGGTTIKAAIAAEDGRLFGRSRSSTGSAAGPEQVVENIIALVHDLADRARREGYDVAAAGVVVPGVVDERAGIAVEATNIGWRDVPLRELIQRRLGLPVRLGHDVRAGALAEGRRGAAQQHRDFLFLPIGTGIGAALVIDATPYPGAHWAAAEIGHLPVSAGGASCACGRRNCLETIASAAAIARRYSAASGETVTGAVDVARRVRRGDETATRVWQEAVRALTDALEVTTVMFDPSLVVLGGGLAESGALLLEPLQDQLVQRLQWGRPPEIRRAVLGDEAGCVGAALLALEMVGLTR